MDCNTVNGFDEGIEFSIRLSSRPNEWIPIKYVYRRRNVRDDDIRIDTGTIRGYSVEQIENDDNGMNRQEIVMEGICNFCVSDSIQFRWLQTISQNPNNMQVRDTWILDDINISITTAEDVAVNLLIETFDMDALE